MRFGRSQPLLAWISLFAITIVPAVGPQRACRAIGTMGHTKVCTPKIFPRTRHPIVPGSALVHSCFAASVNCSGSDQQSGSSETTETTSRCALQTQ